MNWKKIRRAALLSVASIGLTLTVLVAAGCAMFVSWSLGSLLAVWAHHAEWTGVAASVVFGVFVLMVTSWLLLSAVWDDIEAEKK